MGMGLGEDMERNTAEEVNGQCERGLEAERTVGGGDAIWDVWRQLVRCIGPTYKWEKIRRKVLLFISFVMNVVLFL